MIRFNRDNCVGCEMCTLVCNLSHNGVTGLEKGRIKIERNYPSLQDPLFKASCCHQCKNAKCVQACPTGALTNDEEMVNFDNKKCSGCGQCVTACPFNAIWMDENSGTAFKCDLCNGNPVCIQFCPHDALVYNK